MSATPKSQAVEITWLKNHPRQHDFFADTSESELEELADDLKKRGQQDPIHCCLDGTIIRGHRRLRAAKMLEWSTIQAVIRHDLTDPNDQTVVDELIVDNVMRRQLDDLALARCYRELKRSHMSECSGERGDVRDLLAARLNCGKSGRSLDRLERLLKLPRYLQDTISHGSLNKAHGEAILKLSKEDREKLIKALRSGEAVPDVLRRFSIAKSRTRKSPKDLGQELLAFFKRHVKELNGNISELDQTQVRGADAQDVIDQAINFLTVWRDRKSDLREQSLASIRT